MHKENTPDCYDLLTMHIEPDMEEHLRSMGLDWFFERRDKFQEYLKVRNAISTETNPALTEDLIKLVELVKKPLNKDVEQIFEAIEAYMKLRREWKSHSE